MPIFQAKLLVGKAKFGFRVETGPHGEVQRFVGPIFRGVPPCSPIGAWSHGHHGNGFKLGARSIGK